MPSFILEHLDEIVHEWEAFAATLSPAADAMDAEALRDHARQMLQAIAADIATRQSDHEQALKSQGLGPTAAGETAAESHGALRQQVGFDLGQLVAEFRALRASVLRIWIAKEGYGDERSAREMGRFNEAIDQALAESVTTYSAELAKSRDTFIGILGHDLRTPLGAVWGAVEILSRSADGPVREAAHRAATRSLGAMRTMIADLLDFTRTRLGKGIPVVPAAAELGEVCRASIDQVAIVHPGSSITLTTSGALDGTFDADRMQQVVANLLGNAVQHGDLAAGVTVHARGDDSSLTLAVSNQGPEIAAERLESIFDPMTQCAVEDGDPRRAGNLGLGLFIAREIVIAHGGRIDAASSRAAGTTFTVRLPRHSQRLAA